MHGPVAGVRDGDGHVNCEVTGFVLAADGVPTVYVSGDNASIGVVAEVARRVGPIEVAVLFIGAARVPTKERGRPLTLTSERAAAAAAVLGASVVVAAHFSGWAHFSEGLERVIEAFDQAGLCDVLRTADPSCFAVFVDQVPAAAQAARTARVSCGVACSGHGLRNLAAMMTRRSLTAMSS